MTLARITIHPEYVVAPVPARLFGSFVEHMGRCVYTGIYEPGHPSADADGFRQDVLELVSELGVTHVRYPGGNFVSNYRWEDGVGPVADRPTRLDLAWHTTETNEFGLAEFTRWAKKAGIEPVLTLNLGTRGVPEALSLLEYCNHPSGSSLSDLRRAHGDDEPFNVRMWCLGNELDGPWQTGHKTATEYGRLAAETARAMRQFDPTLELVASGSSGRGMATFGQWEYEVLSECLDQVDWISLHAYYEVQAGDLAGLLASSVDMDRFITSVIAVADAVAAAHHSDKKLLLSFDEWNVWYMSRMSTVHYERWTSRPRLAEDDYTVADAVTVGSLLITLLRHCDRVRAASLAQLVNVIAPIRTEPGGPAWRQTTFHPFAETARHARGTALQTLVDAPTMPTAAYGDVPVLDAVAVRTDDGLAVFLVNRSAEADVDIEIDLAAWPSLVVTEAKLLHEDDPWRTNSVDAPNAVELRPHPDLAPGRPAGHRLTFALPPVSWAVLTLARAAG